MYNNRNKCLSLQYQNKTKRLTTITIMQPLEMHPEDLTPNWGKESELQEKPQSWVSKSVFEMLIKQRDDKERANQQAGRIR